VMNPRAPLTHMVMQKHRGFILDRAKGALRPVRRSEPVLPEGCRVGWPAVGLARRVR
jgi:hypothetical protein